MSTHNIPFSILKKRITLNYSKFAAKGFFFLGTQERVRNSRGSRAISVRATKVLLYTCLKMGWSGGAMVLGKLPVPGCPTHLDQSTARTYCACSRCG